MSSAQTLATVRWNWSWCPIGCRMAWTACRASGRTKGTELLQVNELLQAHLASYCLNSWQSDFWCFTNSSQCPTWATARSHPTHRRTTPASPTSARTTQTSSTRSTEKSPVCRAQTGMLQRDHKLSGINWQRHYRHSSLTPGQMFPFFLTSSRLAEISQQLQTQPDPQVSQYSSGLIQYMNGTFCCWFVLWKKISKVTKFRVCSKENYFVPKGR